MLEHSPTRGQNDLHTLHYYTTTPNVHLYIQCTLYIVLCAVYTGWWKMSDERLVADIPAELKRLVDADERMNREVVEAALWNEFGGERKAAVERRIENKREQLHAAQNTLESERQNVEEIREEIAELQAAKENVEEKEEREAEKFAEVSERFPETEKLDPSNPAVKNWAEKFDLSPSEFIDQLRDYREDNTTQ